jgi:hypothetical protein
MWELCDDEEKTLIKGDLNFFFVSKINAKESAVEELDG